MLNSRPATVRVLFNEVFDGTAYRRKLLAEPAGNSLVRRNGKRYNTTNGVGALEESSSLAIGPVLLLRHQREPIPFVGDILPSHFWTTRVLRRIEATPAQSYPPAIGNTFDAALWVESRYATGDVIEVEKSQISCKAVERIRAERVHRTLEGNATKIRCEETNPINERLKSKIVATMGDWADFSGATQVFASESWYIDSLGLTIQTWSQEALRFADGSLGGDLTTTRTIDSIQVLQTASQ